MEDVKACNCGPDCTCGCQEGKECTCNCGCKDGEECTCEDCKCDGCTCKDDE